MKLAEALIERADLKRKISQVGHRMKASAKVQEGDEPAESTEKLYSVYESLMDKLEALIIKINKTNNSTPFDEITLADVIAKRDCLRNKISEYQSLYSEAAIIQERYSRNEIKFVRFVDVVKLQSKIDRLSKEYRELDTKIQGLNWTIDLVE